MARSAGSNRRQGRVRRSIGGAVAMPGLTTPRLLVAVLVLSLAAASCGSTPAPTATGPTGQAAATNGEAASTGAAPVPSAESATLPASGGIVALTDGTSLSVPAGAVPAGTVARIEPVASVAETATESSPLLAVGAAYRFDLSDASPSKPVTITMRFSPAGLPAGTTPAEVFLAYRDDATGQWVPVSSTVDAAAGTVSAAVSHLSIWNPMTWDWHYWIPILKAAASGKVTDLRDRLATFVSGCETSTGIFSVDNAAANQMIEGCLTKTSASDATVEIRNLRAFALEVSGPPGSPTATPELLPPGGTTDVTVKTSAAQPVVVSADVTEVGLCHSVVQVLLRFLPFDRLLTTSPQYWPVVAAVTDRVPMLCTSVGPALKKAQAGDAQGAAATLVGVLQGADFQRALLDALGEAGAKYGLAYLGALTTDRLREVFTIVNLGDLIVTTITFFGDHFFNAQTSVNVNWTQPAVGPPPKPTDTSYTLVSQIGSEGNYDWTYRLTWSEPAGVATGFHIYLVFGCYATEAGQPCIRKGLHIPDRDRSLVGTVDGSSRSFTVLFSTNFEGGGPTGVLVAAFNMQGESKAAIAHTELYGFLPG